MILGQTDKISQTQKTNDKKRVVNDLLNSTIALWGNCTFLWVTPFLLKFHCSGYNFASSENMEGKKKKITFMFIDFKFLDGYIFHQSSSAFFNFKFKINMKSNWKYGIVFVHLLYFKYIFITPLKKLLIMFNLFLKIFF